MAEQRERYRCERCRYQFYYNPKFALRCNNCGEQRNLLKMSDISSTRLINEVKELE